MYEKPRLERFGTLRQLTAAPFTMLGSPLSVTASSLSLGSAGCDPNVPLGDPSACSRS